MHIIIHYSGEIGSKGANRNFFSKKLKDNIRSAFKRSDYKAISSENSRILIETDANKEKLFSDKLKRICGISSFSFASKTENKQEKIIETAKRIGTSKDGFNIKIFISNKNAGISYDELKKSLSGLNNIHSKNDLTVEILDSGAYIYTQKSDGTGGLPVGTSGKLISLLSGGIDSPVAAYKMFRRGCSISFVHYYNPTTVKESVKKKIIDLTTVLSNYQFKTKLYIVKFDDMQRHIIANVPAEVRMIVYRRMMLKIGEKILEKEGAKGFVTGDSLSQVASQTLDNIGIIYNATRHTMFAPLIGEDKDSIIKLSKEIGTYDISIQPYSDCCSFFVAEHPQTHAELGKITDYEKRLDIKNLVESALKDTEIKVFMN